MDVHAVAVAGEWQYPQLMREARGSYYFGLGPSHLPDGYGTVVKDYGLVDWDEIEIVFARDYPPEVGVRDSAGWIAPDGRMFPCRGWEHDVMAWRVFLYYYRKQPASVTVEMERAGWIRLYDDGFSHNTVPTQRQINTLGVLLLITKSERLAQRIRDVFEEVNDGLVN